MKSVSDKTIEKIKTHFIYHNIFNHAVCETMGKNILRPGIPRMSVWGMLIACWMPKATFTLSEYVILAAFILQKWLHDRASTLHFMYIVCLVLFCLDKFI
jgi:hypothetical protein